MSAFEDKYKLVSNRNKMDFITFTHDFNRKNMAYILAKNSKDFTFLRALRCISNK